MYRDVKSKSWGRVCKQVGKGGVFAFGFLLYNKSNVVVICKIIEFLIDKSTNFFCWSLSGIKHV